MKQQQHACSSAANIDIGPRCAHTRRPALAMAALELGVEQWGHVLQRCVRPGTLVGGMTIHAVDYDCLTGSGEAAALLAEYLQLLAELDAAELAAMAPDVRKALLMNAYNAFTINLIVTRFRRGQHVGIEDLGTEDDPVWEQKVATLAGIAVSLDEVAIHFI